MAQDYDKIFKENIEGIIIPLAEKLLHIHLDPQHLEKIPPEFQRTMERKPDFLKKVLHPNSTEDYILHIEFQVDDKDNMIQRMLEYYALCYKKYQMPLDQYVFYIGEDQAKMRSELSHKNINFRFILINFLEIDYRIFTDSNDPEEVILGILGRFEQNKTDEVITEILHKIQSAPINTLRKQKCLIQLEILSNLRKLRSLIIEKINNMPLVYDIESDPRYIEGIEKGREKTLKEAIIKMLRKGLSHEQISNLLEVSSDFIKDIEKPL
jgi:hypothetical protein